jgi:alcohol dehydrogenase, propanol-preferring
VLGIGGLGHLAIQYSRQIGFEVVAIGRGGDRAEFAKKFGAHHYVDSAASDPMAALQELGGAQVILCTAPSGKAVSETFKGLRPGGVAIVLGVGDEPIESSAIFSSSEIAGWKARSQEIQRLATLRFASVA